jgi:hypothetical protein
MTPRTTSPTGAEEPFASLILVGPADGGGDPSIRHAVPSQPTDSVPVIVNGSGRGSPRMPDRGREHLSFEVVGLDDGDELADDAHAVLVCVVEATDDGRQQGGSRRRGGEPV